MNLQPLGDRLIVEVLDEEELTVSGIVLPETAKEAPQRGKVLAVGPGARNQDTGEYIQMDVGEGDEVVFSKYGGTEFKLGTDEVLILRESDVAIAPSRCLVSNAKKAAAISPSRPSDDEGWEPRRPRQKKRLPQADFCKLTSAAASQVNQAAQRRTSPSSARVGRTCSRGHGSRTRS
jgi:chaperonin GroES